MADEWKLWLGGVGFVLVLIVWSQMLGANAGRFMDLVAGVLLGAFFVMWSLGGHISAFSWQLGAMGEQDTAKEIEKLASAGWHCEHDVVHAHGNWDHVIVGPGGVYVLDSKLIHGKAVASGDALRAGRLCYSGLASRRAAAVLKEMLDAQLGYSAGWVQGVVVVWGDFPQRRHEENHVMYIAGEELVSWLTSRDVRLNEPQIAARTSALRLVRERLESES